MENNIDGGVRQSPFALYRGSDFFESFIPSIWFLLGVVIVEVLFFGAVGVHDGLQELVKLRNTVAITSDDASAAPRSGTLQPNASDLPKRDAPSRPLRQQPVSGVQTPSADDATQVSLSLEILFVVLLAIITISLVFILGQVMNGLSAAILDRVVVKKLLHYPFDLYQRWRREPLTASNQIVRRAVLQASYLVHCINLIPVILLEGVISCSRSRSIETGSLGVAWMTGVSVLVVLHLGAPAIFSVRKYDLLASRRGATIIAIHACVVAFVSIGLVKLIKETRDFRWIFALALGNFIFAVADRMIAASAIARETTIGAVFFYARVSFVNFIYWAAKLVNYSDLAKPQITAEAEELIGDSGSSDLFWAAYLTVQNVAPRSFLPITHFLALYGMMRNLCNATMLVWLYSVVVLVVRSSPASTAKVLWWAAALAIFGYLCFARYLYLYGSYFSKYVLRATAVLHRLNRLGLLTSEPARR